MITMIVAIDENYGIGKDGGIPWFYSEDMKFFARTTKGGTCIMGRITYESILEKVGERKDLLPGRQSLVISRNKELILAGAEGVQSLPEAIQRASNDDIFIIGGESIYTDALPLADRVYITRVPGNFDCDVHVNEMMRGIDRYYHREASTISESGLRYECYVQG